MNEHFSNTISPAVHTSASRSQVVGTIQAALANKEFRFARQAALFWLAVFPGDLPVGFLHAEALLAEIKASSFKRQNYHQVIAILQSLCKADPEFLQAQEMMAGMLYSSHSLRSASPAETTLRQADIEVFGNVFALGGSLPQGAPIPDWGYQLRQARQSAAQCSKDEVARMDGDHQIHHVLLSNPLTPLAALTHLQIEACRDLPGHALQSLAEIYHQRWPGCVQFTLYLARSWMESGHTERAVDLLHQSVSLDVTGQVPQRLWGNDHPYRTIWPDHLEAPVFQDLPIPAGVAAAMGWNQLPAPGYQRGGDQDLPVAHGCPGSPGEGKARQKNIPALEPEPSGANPEALQQPPSHASDPEEPESLLSFQADLESLAARLKQPTLARLDGRFPVYVIFTTRRGLQTQYGEGATLLIEEAMLRLAEAVCARKGWDALLFYGDDGQAFSVHGMVASLCQKPSRPSDAWSLKLSLVDLDAALGKRGEMIGAVLIVGGTEVIPFHLLPNPVDDDDVDVPSDNPYATLDENYFIPEWPVGRLPGGVGPDAGALLGMLHAAAAAHRQAARKQPWLISRCKEIVQEVWPGAGRMRRGLGYTAAVWQNASRQVFRPLGKRQNMLVSPPIQADGAGDKTPQAPASRHDSHTDGHPKPINRYLYPARMGYFNLHGLPDTVEWYGQRDPADRGSGPDYPVALRPADLDNGRPGAYSPKVVFTEACFGAHILGKTVESSMALKFLSSGSLAVVGATCIAYGAIGDPLTAADLLGVSFWSHLQNGLPAGEALRRAKIGLAREMHHRQGYLDGEDQKTLISFVLYGDPLAQPFLSRRNPKGILRTLHTANLVKTICDRAEEDHPTGPVPPETLSYVKAIVAHYLPGMTDSQLHLTREHAACHGQGHRCPTAQIGAKSRPKRDPNRQVITLSKQVQQSASVHHMYARLTLNAEGKLVKLVVSR